MKETFGKQNPEKNGLKKSVTIAKARFFAWIRAIFNIVHNFKEAQEIINHQNREIEEMRLLVNFLLKNTNRYIRRRWIRYLDAAQEIGIWDAEIVKLCPSDKIPTGADLSEYLDNNIPPKTIKQELEEDAETIFIKSYPFPNTEPNSIADETEGA